MKELFSVVLAARRWASLWQDQHVVVYTDNQTTMFLINKASSRDSLVMAWLRELFWLSACHNFKITAKFIPGHENIISDTLSRLHDPSCLAKLPRIIPLGHQELVTHTINFYGHVSQRCFLRLQELWTLTFRHSEKKHSASKQLHVREPPRKTYSSQQLAYLRFCVHFGLRPVPAERYTMIIYTAFLARSLKPTSIPSYLNVVRLMHAEARLPSPLEDWELGMVRRGIARTLGCPPKQKLAITLDILLAMHARIDFSLPILRAFWAACLVAFYAFLRKSSLVPKGSTRDGLYLCTRDVVFDNEHDLVYLQIRHSKTIQFGQRLLTIPLSGHPRAELCPFVP